MRRQSCPEVFFEMPAHFRIGIAGDTDTLEEGLDDWESVG